VQRVSCRGLCTKTPGAKAPGVQLGSTRLISAQCCRPGASAPGVFRDGPNSCAKPLQGDEEIWMRSQQTDSQTKEHLTKRNLANSRLLCFVSAVFPLLALLGWIFNIQVFRQVYSGLPAMHTNAAFGLILVMIAILLTGSERRSRKTTVAACGLGGVVLLLGLLTLSEYFFGVDFGIDRLFFGLAGMPPDLYSGRLSPQAAANFMFFGAALLVYNLRSLPIRLGQTFVLVAGANASIVFSGYVLGTAESYGFPMFGAGMAVHTAAAFILLAVALLLSRPDDGMMSVVTSGTRSGAMTRQILFTCMVAPPVVGILTRVGVVARWYSASAQISLFVVVIVAIVLWTTWRAARQLESDELLALAVFEESQAANEKVRQTQERFELALRGAELGAWDWNVKSGETVFNPRWAEMRGFRLEEIRPHVDSWISGVHPDDWPGVQKTLADHFQGIVPEYDVEFRAKTKSGDWVWILARGKVFTRDEKGQPHRMVGTEFDISERKRLGNEQRFLAEVGAVLNTSLDIDETLGNIARLAVRDLGDLCIIDLNEEGGGLLKVMSRDASKAWISDLFLQLPLNRHRPDWLRTVLESKRPVLMERLSSEAVDMFCPHPEHMRALWEAGLHSALAVPLVAHGNLLGAIVLFSFSPSHAYGPADLRLAQKLADRSALSIENSRLYLEAQRAIKTRENVLAMVSHDLKNPVATIGLVAHLLQQHEPIDAARLSDLAGKIRRAVDNMLLLISDLLDFSKIQSGTFSVDVHAVKLDAMVMPVIDSVRTLADARHQTIELNISPGLPEVLADSHRIGQVLSNLLGNAIKFTPDGRTIRVSARQQADTIVVSVSDEGPGIPAEHLSRVFDRFWQSKEKRQMGSGLGLSIAKGIVEAHRGTIWAESELGKGCSFYFTLPLANLNRLPGSAA